MYKLIGKYGIPFFALLLAAAGCAPEGAERVEREDSEVRTFSTEYEEIRLVRIADGLQFPWSIAFLPDERILITEKPGTLQLVENGQLTEISGVPEVSAVNQGGLLEVSVHPDFEQNGWIYLTYSEPAGDGDTYTTLGRGRLADTALEDFEVLFRQDRASSPGRHYGSRLAWASDGTLFMSVGDRGAEPPRAQDPGDHAGTLLRLNDDGSAAAGNPFAGRDGYLPEIWSYGHRNIQGLAIDFENDRVWATEHGPRGGDELNLVEPGNNYGWPVATLGRDYGTGETFPHAETRHREGMVDPVHEFLPTHSPSGLVVVTSEHFPNWQGNLLVGGLRGERIRRVVIEQNEVVHEEELLLREVGRIRDVRQGPDGYFYLVNNASEASLYRVEPAE